MKNKFSEHFAGQQRTAFTLAEVFSEHPADQRRTAFTLAEVLITIGVLGVVASLTMPTLISSYQNKAFATQIHKYSLEIADAVDLFLTEEGKNSLASTSAMTKEGLDAFVKSHLNVVKTCEVGASGCFASSYRTLKGTATTDYPECPKAKNKVKTYVLSNSASVCLTQSGDGFYVDIDVNGKDMPNMTGRDLFQFDISPTGAIVPKYSGNCAPNKTMNDAGCFDYLMNNNWKMDY